MRKRSPNFYSIAAICKGLGIEEPFFERVKTNKNKLYKMEKRKIGKKIRPIYIAKGELRTFLRKLHLRIRKVEIADEFLGGVRGCSVIDNAKKHANKKYVLNLDLKDFFPSVKQSRIENIFRKELGCTTAISKILGELCSADDQLPQGFATSPLLSVLTLSDLANDLRTLMKKHGLTFTFWIDDLTISGGNNPRDLILSIETLCRKHGLKLNKGKIHLGIQGKTIQEVTGVVINGKDFSPSAGYTAETEMMLYIFEKYGWEAVIDHFSLECDKEEKLLELIQGRIAWIRRTKKDAADKLSTRWNKLDQ